MRLPFQQSVAVPMSCSDSNIPVSIQLLPPNDTINIEINSATKHSEKVINTFLPLVDDKGNEIE